MVLVKRSAESNRRNLETHGKSTKDREVLVWAFKVSKEGCRRKLLARCIMVGSMCKSQAKKRIANDVYSAMGRDADEVDKDEHAQKDGNG